MEKMIDQIEGRDTVNNEQPLVAKIELYEKLDGEHHIKKLIRYLNYEGEMATTREKFVYGIRSSKVDSIKKGHVAVSLPVITF
jgi:hypothetical protein